MAHLINTLIKTDETKETDREETQLKANETDETQT